MKKLFSISSISSFKDWERCFHYFMERADTFAIIFQGDPQDTTPGGLNQGKKEFLALPSITITPYRGMKDSFICSGELTKAAQELFLNGIAASFEGAVPDLWCFQFLKEDLVTLSVEDFGEAFFPLDESELASLSSQGIDTASMDDLAQRHGEYLSSQGIDPKSIGELNTTSAETEDDFSYLAFSNRQLDESDASVLEDFGNELGETLAASLKKSHPEAFSDSRNDPTF